jgi:predicted DNA-binding transcriptional regulator YafY
MRFQPRLLPAADAAAFVRAGIQSLPTAPRPVEALVHAPAAAVRSAVGQWVTVEEVDQDSCRLRMSVDNLDWPALALGAVGAEFEVIQPPELVDHLRDWAARFTRATNGSATA